MTFKWLFFFRRCENCPATGGFAGSIIHLKNCISLLNMPPKLQHFFYRVMLTFGSNPSENPGWRCKVLFYPVDNKYVACPPSEKISAGASVVKQSNSFDFCKNLIRTLVLVIALFRSLFLIFVFVSLT